MVPMRQVPQRQSLLQTDEECLLLSLRSVGSSLWRLKLSSDRRAVDEFELPVEHSTYLLHSLRHMVDLGVMHAGENGKANESLPNRGRDGQVVGPPPKRVLVVRMQM